MYNNEEKEELIKFGKLVRELRSNKGFSQESFADSIGLHRTYMGGVERGERNVSYLNLMKIARALDMDINTLKEGITS